MSNSSPIRDDETPEQRIARLGGTTTRVYPISATREDQQKDERPPLRLEPFVWVDPTTIAPRKWLLGSLLVRHYFTQLAGIGGGGKTTLGIAIALSVATGRDLLGIGFKVFERVPVWFLTLEDDKVELQRRIAAACMHYGIDPKELEGWLFLNAGRDRQLIIARPNERSETEVKLVDCDAMEDQIKAAGIGLVVIDPFVKSHQLNENSNVLMDQVATALDRICYRTGCAALMAHHTRKAKSNGAQTADDIRGAGAFTFAARVNVILAPASEAEARSFGIPADEAWRYARLDDAKVNLAPREKARWFKLDSQHLGNVNVDALRPGGDSVQVMDRWFPPKPFDGLDQSVLETVFNRIRSGPGEGRKWSPSVRSDIWVGNTLMESAKRTKEQASKVSEAWIKSGVLIKSTYKDPKTRKPDVGCVTLNEAKAQEILAGPPSSLTPDDDA